MHHGLNAAEISRIVVKSDGKSHFSERAIQLAVCKLKEKPGWRGERRVGSGAPRKTSKAQDRALIREVLANRGKQKVTVQQLKRKFDWARKLSDGAIEDRLHDAELAKLRRRRKVIVTKMYLAARVAYCQRVLRMRESTLLQWAYTDGTVWFLDRTAEENEHSQRAALGGWVWRKADGSDAMYQDCLGPSTYKKAQGTPVRVWGMLAEGVLNVHVLEEGETMDQHVYEELIETKFERWLGACRYLVQDFERCLRCRGPLAEMKRIGIELVECYPKLSQDFNAIENAWKLARDRLYDTLPKDLESRSEFILRLQGATRWINTHKRDELIYLSTNQRERCLDCLAAKPPGGRTTW